MGNNVIWMTFLTIFSFLDILLDLGQTLDRNSFAQCGLIIEVEPRNTELDYENDRDGIHGFIFTLFNGKSRSMGGNNNCCRTESYCGKSQCLVTPAEVCTLRVFAISILM